MRERERGDGVYRLGGRDREKNTRKEREREGKKERQREMKDEQCESVAQSDRET